MVAIASLASKMALAEKDRDRMLGTAMHFGQTRLNTPLVGLLAL